MKKVLMIMIASFLTAGVFAQDKMEKKMDHKMDQKMGAKKDCVMMEGGKMMVMKGGTTMGMDHNMKMKNGSTVMTDGTVKMKSGKTVMMKDGDCMYMDGKMSKMKMDKMKSKM